MSDPGAEAGGEAASAAAAEAAAARAPLDACFAPMALETPETSSDARRAVAPAADASWRAGFHRGYAPGGYARGGTDLLRALASASAYVPAPATGGDPANLDARFARGAPSSAEAPTGARETARATQPSATPEGWTDPSGDRVDVVTTNRYVESSGTHSIQAWASALLAASRSQTKPRTEKPRRRDAARVRATARDVTDSPSHETRRTVTPKRTNTQPAYTNVCVTRDMARRALRTPKVLAALARRAVADADSADAFVFDAGETRDATDATTDRTRHVNTSTARVDTRYSYGWRKRCSLPPPTASVTDAFRVSVAVGYQGDALRVAPKILERNPSAWTAAPFAPVGARGKHVCSFVIAPSGIVSKTALETVVEIRAQYEQMRLGTMEAGASLETTASRDDENAKASSRSVFSTDEKTLREDASAEVFAYDPVTNGSFDEALARLVSVARASTHTGPFLAYLAGPSAVLSSSAENDTTSRLATYAAARVAELADEDATRADFDFVALPRDRLGRRRCTPAFARERATSAFRVAARRERKSTRAPSEGEGNRNDARSVFEIAAREPPVTVSRRSRRLEDETSLLTKNRDCDVTSATLCAYAFVTTEEDRALVVALTDDAGETFAVETTYASSVSEKSTPVFADATPSSRVATANANLADWLVRRTRAFTAARAAAAGDAYASPASAASAETTARDGELHATKNATKAETRETRAAKRARAFFGASTSPSAAEETFAFSSVGAGVVVTEVVPANQESGDRAFANVLRSAFFRRLDEKRQDGDEFANRETAKKKPRVLLGETRLGFLRAEDEDELFFSDGSVASLRADGSVATHAGGRRARDGHFVAIATRVAPVDDFSETDDSYSSPRVADVAVKRRETTRDSSRVAFAFASLARAARAVRGVDRGERARVRDVAPPHVAACASLAATLRDLERIAAGRGE